MTALTDYAGTDIYCDLIIPRKIDVRIVLETANVLAFYHTKPHWENHVVVTPKMHIASLLELDGRSEVASELLKVVQQVAAQMKNDFGGCRVATNLGEYQDSKHLHVHVAQGQRL